MENVKVSIIIPVYNPGELFNRCLDSASNQTLRDIEIICIDDGSSDGSLDTLNQYALDDSRFKVFTQSNSGAGNARNKGLEYANGEYIVFLDADDFIELDMCESLYNHAKSMDSDLILFDNRWYLEDNATRDFIHFDSFDEDYEKFVFDYHFIHDKVFSGFFGVIWTKFYKRTFLKDNVISFPSHKLYNDFEFHLKAVLLAKKIAYYPKIFYHYNKSGHSSLQTDFVGKREAIVFYDVLVGIMDFLIDNGFMDEFRIDFLNFIFRHFKTKVEEMDEIYKNEFFLKIKGFLESILIRAEEFNQMNYRNLPIYIHIVNSKSYEEFKLRMESCDMELFNPNNYPGFKETFNSFNDQKEDLNGDFDGSDLESQLAIERQKNECNDFFIIQLEQMLNLKNKELNQMKEISNMDPYVDNLKKTADEYYRIKENYKIIQKQNKELINENAELKKGFYNRIKKLF